MAVKYDFYKNPMAIKRLKELVVEGKLRKEGASRSPIYRPAPGHYGVHSI